MPIKWEIHEKPTPRALVERGVVKCLTKCSELSETDKDQALIVNVVDVDDFEAYGEDDGEMSDN